MSTTRISAEVRDRVRQQAGNRCGYCLSPQRLVLGWLEIEHIKPPGSGGTDDEQNLWLACRLCNNFKNDQTWGVDDQTGQCAALFDPRHQLWPEHFEWSPDGTRLVAVSRDADALDDLIRKAGEDPENCPIEGIPDSDCVLGGLNSL